MVVCLGTLVVPFDSSVNVAFPSIVRGLAIPIPSIQWVVIAYTLTYAALMLAFGRVGDILGYRCIFLIGTAWSAVAFLACAWSPDFSSLLVARTLQGVGAAMALSCGPALATSLFPEIERTRVLGLYTMVFGFGGILGTILAGALVARWGWPAVFWFRAPISLVAFMLAWTLPSDRRAAAGLRFDIPGAVLLIVGITALLLTLNQLQHFGEPALLIGAALLAAASLGGFIVWESRVSQPLLDLRYFRNKDFAVANGSHVLLNLAGFSVMLLVPFYLDRFGGLSVPQSGAVLSASAVGLMLASPAAGRMARFVSPRRLALVGAVAMTAGQLSISTTGELPALPILMGGMLIQGAGLGLFQVAFFDIVTAALPREDRGVAGSLVMMTRTVGVVTGATTLMLVFRTIEASGLASGTAPTQAFINGFRGVFLMATAISAMVVAVGLLCGWWRPEDQRRSTQ